MLGGGLRWWKHLLAINRIGLTNKQVLFIENSFTEIHIISIKRTLGRVKICDCFPYTKGYVPPQLDAPPWKFSSQMKQSFSIFLKYSTVTFHFPKSPWLSGCLSCHRVVDFHLWRRYKSAGIGLGSFHFTVCKFVATFSFHQERKIPKFPFFSRAKSHVNIVCVACGK